MKVKYNKGGKSPVDPPKTSPESRSTYKIGDMHFMGEEADRLIAFDEYLVKEFPDLDLFQRAEQVEKFLNAKAHKSNEAMDSYSVDPALKEVKAPSLMDSFDSEFGSSMFGGSDPFDDDPDVQRMREEAASRENKKGKRNKRFENGGKMKVKYSKGGMTEYGKGGSMKEMYASGGMLKALLDDPKQREMAKSLLSKYEDGGMVDDDPKKKSEALKDLEMITKSYLMEALRKAGVGGKYAVTDGNNMGMGSYDEVVEMAKQKGVYQDARMAAVDEWRRKYGEGDEK